MRTMGDIVKLDALDLLHIALFSERQRCVKRSLSVPSRKYDQSKGEYEVQYIGTMGEYAISKHCDVPIDTNIHVGGDNGTDLVINGWGCQVKTTVYGGKTIDVIVNSMDEFKAQVLIGVQVLSPTRVKILGCIGRRRFRKCAITKDYGYGERLKVSAQELAPIDVLNQIASDHVLQGGLT